jgi:hypothetical protein
LIWNKYQVTLFQFSNKKNRSVPGGGGNSTERGDDFDEKARCLTNRRYSCELINPDLVLVYPFKPWYQSDNVVSEVAGTF